MSVNSDRKRPLATCFHTDFRLNHNAHVGWGIHRRFPASRTVKRVVNGPLDGDQAWHDRDVQAGVVGVPQFVLQGYVVGGGFIEGQPNSGNFAEVDAPGTVVKWIGGCNAVLFDHVAGLGGRHEGRLDLTRGPVGVQSFDQSRRAGHMRAGHRGALNCLEVLAGFAAVDGKRIGRHSGQDLHAWSGHIGFADAQGLAGAPARAEGCDYVPLSGDGGALCEGAGHAGVVGHEVQESISSIKLQMDGRDKVIVGSQTLKRGIV